MSAPTSGRIGRHATPRLSDEAIERYSRQLILQEVGPRGQERLGAARVAIVGTGAAAERVVAYLAAAGIGWIAADPTLHGAVDRAAPDVHVVALADATGALDAVVLIVPSTAAASDQVATWRARAAATLWIADGLAGVCPPCPRCASAAATAASPVPPELAALRDALLGTVVATETVKALLAIGTPLAGRVLAYDPTTATITNVAVTARPDCDCTRS